MNQRLRAILNEGKMEYPKVGKPVKSELTFGGKPKSKYKGLDGTYWQAHIIDSVSEGRLDMVRDTTEEGALVASVEWVLRERAKKLTKKF